MLNNNFRFDCTKLKKLGWKSTKNIYEVFYDSYKFYLNNNLSLDRSKNTKKHKLGIIKILYFFIMNLNNSTKLIFILFALFVEPPYYLLIII